MGEGSSVGVMGRGSSDGGSVVEELGWAKRQVGGLTVDGAWGRGVKGGNVKRVGVTAQTFKTKNCLSPPEKEILSSKRSLFGI